MKRAKSTKRDAASHVLPAIDAKRHRPELPRFLVSDRAASSRRALEHAHRAAVFILASAPEPALLLMFALQASVSPLVTPAIDHLLRSLPQQQPLPVIGDDQVALATAFYHLVRLASGPEAVRRDWSDLIALVKQCDGAARWFASRALAAAYGLDDVATSALVRRSELGPDPFPVVTPAPMADNDDDDDDNAHDFTVDVFGAVVTPSHLPRSPCTLAPTPALRTCMRRLAMALEYGPCVLVKGPPGSGKTAMAKELAAMCGRALIEVQMDEQSDAQAMLGAVTCTDVPGVFAWTPGAVTLAATRGEWVLVENADRLPAEILSLLMHAVDCGGLMIKQQRVPLAPGFRLVFTTAATGVPSALKGRCAVVAVPAPALDDVLAMARHLFARLPAALLHDIVSAAVRAGMGTRDVLRWLRRVDAFAGLSADRGFVTERERENAVALGGEIVPAEVAMALAGRAVARHSGLPTLANGVLRVGPVVMPRMQADEAAAVPASAFAWTSVALDALHAMSAAVALNEPVLLVGETGAGKTALVQQLAAMAGKRLVVVNMHVSSDSAELVGAFKPLDLAREARAVQLEFTALFAKHFSVQDNRAFLDAVVEAVDKRKWTKVARAWLKGCAEGHRKSAAPEWLALARRAEEFERRASAPAFAFEEGVLVKALRAGHWVLLDEVNLASTETLDRLLPLLDGPSGSLVLSERGDVEPVPRHADFRLFACMNPPNDVGKKALPAAMETRTARVDVAEAVSDADVGLVAARYLEDAREKTAAVVGLFKRARTMAQTRAIVDGAGQRPRYSLRTLVRALESARRLVSAQGFGLQRALREGFEATCLTWLNRPSCEALASEMDAMLPPPPLAGGMQATASRAEQAGCVAVAGFALASGGFTAVGAAEEFVVTPSVAKTVRAVARAVALARYPVLLQGPTSAGKTSVVHHLADLTGHRFVRLNNHEHTDLQEYVGGYSSDPATGSLVFKEGVLVTALRQGHWLVLDELNLAPTEVLEALNRLLDDNRELVVPETGEVVRPHPHFMLFATQNPPGGAYGGRKQLSRALRNRFLEVHVDDIPPAELKTMLQHRSRLPEAFCAAMVNVMVDLQFARSSASLFAGKAGLITARDLLKWADRKPASYGELALAGYSLLAERRRVAADREQIRTVLEKHCKGAVPALLGDDDVPQTAAGMVWTRSMRRLFALLANSCDHAEAVLLVGETGAGKTSAVAALARSRGKRLVTVNLHANTEASDLLGAMRPSPHALFQWVDGPLVQCMRSGDWLLLDELALADDAVLERLNSVLDRTRALLLPERDGETVVAHPDFRLFATMNPGGDFGKRELSPALRNRFTEVWIPPMTAEDDFALLCSSLLPPSHVDAARAMAAFTVWFNARSPSPPLSARDLVAWADFIAHAGLPDARLALAHGCHLVVLDGLPLHMSPAKAAALVADALAAFPQLALHDDGGGTGAFAVVGERFGCAPFTIAVGPEQPMRPRFSFEAPTSASNARRVLRAMQLAGKAVLLEGSPGVGKTGLVAALAQCAGYALERINLSEHTDFADLVGADLPTPEGAFAWRDGPLLAAMRRGAWVLLDELNLAGQTVLEGLNALLDHRGAVYVPELDAEVACAPGFRLFAAQNPPEQGGGRKGLPKSFLSRFSKVYVSALGATDLEAIVRAGFPALGPERVAQVLADNAAANAACVRGETWNLRDMLRRCELAERGVGDDEAVDLVYFARLARAEDRTKLARHVAWRPAVPAVDVAEHRVAVGSVVLARRSRVARLSGGRTQALVAAHLRPLQQLARCVQLGWPALVWGAAGAGKSFVVRALADMTGANLVELPLSPSTDLHDLVGGYAQRDAAAAAAAAAVMTSLGADDDDHSNVLGRDGAAWLAAQKASEAAALGGAPTPRFEWVDGPLVTAMQRGSWLVLDDASQCPPSVLDRLNALLEPRGVLAFNGRVVVPHEAFRVFVVCTTGTGSLSRALVDRCCQVHVAPSAASRRDDALVAREALFDRDDWPSAGRMVAAAAAVAGGTWAQLRVFVRLAERGLALDEARAVAYGDDAPPSHDDDDDDNNNDDDDAQLEPASVFGTSACLFRRDWRRDADVRARRLPLLLSPAPAQLALARSAARSPVLSRAPRALLAASGLTSVDDYCPAELFLGLCRLGLVPGDDWERATARALAACVGPAGACARGEGESMVELYCLPAHGRFARLPEADDWLRALMRRRDGGDDDRATLLWARLLRAAVADEGALPVDAPAVALLDSGLPTPCARLVAARPLLAVDADAPRPPASAALRALQAELDALAALAGSAAARRDVAHAAGTLRWANEDAARRTEQARRAVAVARESCTASRPSQQQPGAAADAAVAHAVFARCEAQALADVLEGRLPNVSRLRALYEATGCVPASRLAPWVELAWTADASRARRLVVEVCFLRLATPAPSVREACRALLDAPVAIGDVAARVAVLERALDAMRACPPDDVAVALDRLLFVHWSASVASAMDGGEPGRLDDAHEESARAWIHLGLARARQLAASLSPLDPRAELEAGHAALHERAAIVGFCQRAWALHRALEFGETAARRADLDAEEAALRGEIEAVAPHLVAPRAKEYRALVGAVRGAVETLLLGDADAVLAAGSEFARTLRRAALDVAADSMVCDVAVPFAHALLVVASALERAAVDGAGGGEDGDVVQRMRRLRAMGGDGTAAVPAMRAAVRGWRARKDAEDRKAAEAASSVVWESKAEANEEDAFRALFPAYHDEFAAQPPEDGGGEDDGGSHKGEALAAAAAAAAPVTVDDVEAVAGAFVDLFSGARSAGAPARDDDDDEWSSFAHARADELAAQLGAVARALRELKG